MLLSFHPSPGSSQKKAQLVLCVDFSKSAQTISDAVRSNFWELYTEFESNHPDTKLQVAIVGFSSKVFGKKDHYVKILLDFNDDPASYFEYVNRKILTSSLADNKVGTALNVAVNDLSWDDNSNVKKHIYIIGNGSIRDEYPLAKKSCEKAIKKNILINILYVLHKKKDPYFGYWQDLSELSGGKIKTIVTRFFNEKIGGKIYENFRAITIENEFVNSTYVPFNTEGQYELERIKLLDSYSKTFGYKVIATRAIYKVNDYNNQERSTWDLVDLYDVNKVDYNSIQKAMLPRSMRKMNNAEIENILKEKSDERKLSCIAITELNDYNEEIRSEASKQPGYKLDLSSTILKIFTASGF